MDQIINKTSKNQIKKIIKNELHYKTYLDIFKFQNELQELVDETIDEVLKNKEYQYMV